MPRFRRVVVVGLDGLEPSIVEAMMAAGRLPHLTRLAQSGSYQRLATTYPPQTPVAWSTFCTGVNPGAHGVFDFLARDPKTYRPLMALNRFEQTSRFLPPKAINGRRARPIWSHLSRAGIGSTVLRCPCSFPPDDFQGQQLSGMGVPDLRGGFGSPTFFTTNADVSAAESETVRLVSFKSANRIETTLPGPRAATSDLEAALVVEVDHSAGRATISADGKGGPLVASRGEWTDWLQVKFRANLFTTISGIVRFYLARLEPHFELYASPVNFDPQAPMFPISNPPGYARQLSAALGSFYTAGMAEDTTGLNNDRIDEPAFLQQCQLLMGERRAMMLSELGKLESGLFFILFDTPDRLQHMFWRCLEPDHPANAGREFAPWAQVIYEHYEACDAIVGEALEQCDESTLFIALSDHGFTSFRRGLNLNAWLVREGLLTLKSSSDAETALLGDVDWERSRAYAMGLGGIYLNLAGREGNGIVDPREAAALQSRLVAQLTGLKDSATGAVGVRSAVAREEIYRGPFVDEAPDVLVNFAPGHRTSWKTALGGVGESLWESNTKRWSGDHIVDPAAVPGVLFVNYAGVNGGPRMIDLAPTIMAALGAPRPPEFEGRELLAEA